MIPLSTPKAEIKEQKSPSVFYDPKSGGSHTQLCHRKDTKLCPQNIVGYIQSNTNGSLFIYIHYNGRDRNSFSLPSYTQTIWSSTLKKTPNEFNELKVNHRQIFFYF